MLFPRDTLRILLLAAVLVGWGGTATAGVNRTEAGAFIVVHELLLPGSPESIYDAVTGDISGWWDHSFSDSPKAIYIEPKPGGGFYEIFDDEGNGALHATVIYADRGKLLRFEGPLGLSGSAVSLVCSFELEPWVQGDSTRVKLTVSAAGQIGAGWAEIVDQVWYHFLFEQLKPYVESGKHLKKTRGDGSSGDPKPE
ncbi:MAG TPA: SRPBCC domain-containing protein [Acidobacteriota bacterium]|nr:SRPBCC domain-containing protein [Acidobacteriota bacterium]